jgi:putative acetyltransferase
MNESNPDVDAENAQSELFTRALRPGDCEGVTELFNLPGVRFGTLRLPYQTPEATRKRIEDRLGQDIGLVALTDERIVGMAGLSRLNGRRAHVGEITLIVHDAYVGKGIGTKLLTELVETSDKWLGLRRLELTVYVDNKSAIALYRKFGFEIEGTHRAYSFRDGAFADAYCMARLIGI